MRAAAICMLLAPALLEPLSEAELVRRAERILIGQVTSLTGHWNADQTRIFTRVELKVLRQMKGTAAGPTAALEVLGGTVGTLTSQVGGTPQFVLGEKVVVFTQSLEEQGRRYETVLGWAQGKFRLIEGEGRAPARLERDLEGIGFTGATPASVLTLEQVERAIQAERSVRNSMPR